MTSLQELIQAFLTGLMGLLLALRDGLLGFFQGWGW